MNDNTAAKHAALTASLVAQLEQGVAPWVRPWTTTGLSDLPTNVVSEKHYHGANILALWVAQTAIGYPTAEWVTFKQARDLGGSVCKGEHGSPIFFVSAFEREDDQGNVKRVPFLKSYTVFNVAQCEGLPWRDREARGRPRLLLAHPRRDRRPGPRRVRGPVRVLQHRASRTRALDRRNRPS